MMRVNVDRDRASQMGYSQKDVAQGMLISLSSSFQVGANYWINPANGVDYNVAVQTPTYRMDSSEALMNTPITGGAGHSTQLLSNVASVMRGLTSAVVSHYNVQPVFDVYANVQDRDLGGVAGEVDKVIAEYNPKLPPGSYIDTRGQVETMRSSFLGMAYGLVFAIVLVYFIMVINFQSWTDPFIILMAVPGRSSGILLILFFTHTTISVPALMGAIMSIGVGTANSILLVTFANDLRREGADDLTAAYPGRPHPSAARGDDRHGDAGRDDSHGAGPGRGRRAECASRPRRHRRIDGGDGGDAVRGPGGVQPAAQSSSENFR